MEPIKVTHFSEPLRVWGYESRIRIDELEKKFAGSEQIDIRFVHVFGNVPGKMESSWKDRGGVAGYSEHVKSVVAKFGHVTLHPQVRVRDTPQSSMPSHLFLCAVLLGIAVQP